IVVLFQNDVLASLDSGGELPSEREFVAQIDPSRNPSKPPSLALTDEQLKRLPAPVATAASAAVDVPTSPRTYPPLEPRS
ncbi:MAG: outer membrane protein assembly factor BamE, partial [Pseudomonadota bacterium]|nr:outer membrane protein assembly factor BamE [Pseudomonadota bacterium]